ncbi:MULTISPECIES: hypothetical protein [Fervidicoccus]|uniref:Uncharacterized protein n=1 Tax=Fervidicoccus fontis (strain DSM 19380 / JCM 18336 / VKM B-2539 / Kam940) TaxID=1163730 RepID=H9ZZK0_FERFK|nr:hypothetical protein [Fervidicoccus fontis]AFH42157.1 hypothetical protein FFONT_0165 [Fervidicoccus fontis Kam940]
MDEIAYLGILYFAIFIGFLAGIFGRKRFENGKGVKKAIGYGLEISVLVIIFSVGMEMGSSWETADVFLITISSIMGVLSGILGAFLAKIVMKGTK